VSRVSYILKGFLKGGGVPKGLERVGSVSYGATLVYKYHACIVGYIGMGLLP